MSNSYLLKSHRNPDRLLFDHLRAVAFETKNRVEDVFPKISTAISLSDLRRTAFLVGGTHDVGKGTLFFQNYLLNPKTATDPILKSHSMLSSLYCSWTILKDLQISDAHKDFLALASALVIQGHHGSLKRNRYYTGLENFISKRVFVTQMESFKDIYEVERISKNLGIKSFIEFTKIWEHHFFNLLDLVLLKFPLSSKFNDLSEPYYIINLLYSALLDADRMDVADIKQERVESIQIENLIQGYREKKYQKRDDAMESINKLREILFTSIDQKSKIQDRNQRIFSITAPTGFGKTLTAINFAAKIRKRIQLEKGFTARIIYVAPFITILDQNMKVFSEILADVNTQIQTNILLMHHHLAPVNFTRNVIEKDREEEQEQKKETYSTSQSELLIQGWNSEIIVTTFIQFFNTIFGRYTSQIRRFANMIGSVVILDEVQSIPFEYWSTVRSALLMLSKKFHFTIVLMTATQPLIFAKGEAQELAPSEEMLTIPPRVVFYPRIEQDVTVQEFCRQVHGLIGKHNLNSVLIELNTVPNAVQVYNLLKNDYKYFDDDIFFLSSQIIPKHRVPRIDRIKQKLDNSERVILVTTQVIEAGVDLDFDMGVRDIGPIDSIVQAAGRCNRHGLLFKRQKNYSVSPFYIYRVVDERNEQSAKKVYGRVAIDIANSLITQYQKTPNLTNLVNSYYHEIRRRSSDEDSIIINNAISKLDYEQVEESFKLIDDYKVPVFVEFDEAATEIWTRFLKLNEPSLQRPSRSTILQVRHQMENYLIGISEDDAVRSGLKETSGIYKINYTDKLYDETTGFIRK